jgi:hypothetical protein
LLIHTGTRYLKDVHISSSRWFGKQGKMVFSLEGLKASSNSFEPKHANGRGHPPQPRDRVSPCCPSWPGTCNLPVSASQNAGITDVHHHVRLEREFQCPPPWSWLFVRSRWIWPAGYYFKGQSSPPASHHLYTMNRLLLDKLTTLALNATIKS